ncbi:MAG: NAD(P)/FAD-dependent oxidoreductase [Dehalococcoidia bacterium]|nr:NAD(P)/FAD-dependent oxidoreductase [Dehalococcoidia bacterium]
MYDAIIVGARCAGAPTAMNLARRGHRVLLVDRARFPSDTLSTHALNPEAVARLKGWGLLGRVLEAGSRPIRQFELHCGDVHVAMPTPPGEAIILCPRRTVLDNILVAVAREAGVEVREEFSVRDLMRDDSGRVTGIAGVDEHGDAVYENARIVIGADGRNSIVARQVDAEKYQQLPGLTCGYYSYFEGFDDGDAMRVQFDRNRAIFVFPTNHGQTCLGVEYQRHRWQALRADVDGHLQQAYEDVGLGQVYRKATRVERWLGMISPEWYYRRPFGPGWALVGDAGYLKDPVLGMGINDAFRDSDNLVDALDAVFTGNKEYDEALSAYQQQRDSASFMVNQVNYEFSKLEVTPDMVRMLQMMIVAEPAA